MNKKQLYESIMQSVSKEVKRALNEIGDTDIDFNGTTLHYNEFTKRYERVKSDGSIQPSSYNCPNNHHKCNNLILIKKMDRFYKGIDYVISMHKCRDCGDISYSYEINDRYSDKFETAGSWETMTETDFQARKRIEEILNEQ